jgi:hypothetical protein
MRQFMALAACAFAVFALMPAPAGAATHYRHHHYWQGHGAPYVAYRARPGLGVADPAFMPNPLYDFYRRNHVCAIDEGYGRATRCD